MTAEYNGTDKRAELLADGIGWQRLKTETLPTPETGTNQMILFFKAWHKALPGDLSESTSHSPSTYLGLSFGGTHIETTDSTDAEYDNLFGFAALDASAPFTSLYVVEGVNRSSIGTSANVGATALSAYGVIDSSLNNTNAIDAPFNLRNGETNGLAATYCWRIYTDTGDDTVLYECWMNVDSIDLETFDFSTINPDNPKEQFPVSFSYTRSGTIHGDITGTNWRPSTGVMAFPTHLLARWGGDDPAGGMYIKDPVVHYSTLTT